MPDLGIGLPVTLEVNTTNTNVTRAAVYAVA